MSVIVAMLERAEIYYSESGQLFNVSFNVEQIIWVLFSRIDKIFPNFSHLVLTLNGKP